MENEVKITRFEENDVDELFNMIQESLSTLVITKVYEAKVIEGWRELYNKKYLLGCRKLKHVYVAKINGKVVGSAACELQENAAYISMVYIDPNVQGKGIGRKLIQAVEQDEYCQKTKFLTLSAALSAVKFYQKFGYHHHDNIPTIIVDCGIDVMHLEKEL